MNCARVLLPFVFLVSGCSTVPPDVPLADQHQPSGLNSRFRYEGLIFENYVKQSRAMIAEARTDPKGPGREQIVDGNSPFELKPPASCPQGEKKPYKRGILLTHGLTDSPYLMRYLGTFFQENCFRVMAILLPGHGTRPGDLLEVTWQEWAKAEAYGTNALALEADQVYLAGFSTGGALSIYQSLQDERVRGIFLFSPAVGITPLAFVATYHNIYSWAAPYGKWLDVMKDEDPFKYESFPKNAVDQIDLLIKAVAARLNGKEVKIPVFVAASNDDSTVHVSATLDFFKWATNPFNRMILYTSKPAVFPAGINTSQIETVNSVFPDQNILSSAHTAIVLPPGDAHYGKNGDYVSCAHYYPKEMKEYDTCKNKKANYFGELTDDNLKKGIVQRLMYNPNFDLLKTSMKDFVKEIP